MADKKDPVYKKLAGDLETMLRSGAFRPGDRMPSLRKISSLHNLSLTTALQAFYVLEEKGLIEARPQSGFFVCEKRNNPAPITTLEDTPITPMVDIYDEVNIIREDLIRIHHNGISLGLGIPADAFVPVNSMTKMLQKAARVKGSFGYESGQGNIDLRRQIARRSADIGLNPGADDVIITQGCLDAISIALLVTCRPGDIVAIESPTYFGILQLIEALHMQALEIPVHPRTGISLQHLESATKNHKIKALVVQSGIHNPMGSRMPEENKRKLAELMAKKRIPIIEDDADGELYFGVSRPRSVMHYDTTGNTIYCSSYSKTLGGGCRIGWSIPGPRYKERILKVKKSINIAGPTIMQHAINFFLMKESYERHLRKLRRSFQKQVDHFTRSLTKHMPEGTRISKPAGGFMLWVELPGTMDAEILYRNALEEGISIAPGYIFSAQKKYQNCFRINAAGMIAGEKSDNAIQRLGLIYREILERGAR